MGDFLTEAQYGMSVKGGESGRCPILRMTNQVNGRISPTKLQYAEISDRELANFRVERGDILFNRTNSFELVGRTAIFNLPGEYVFASYLIRLRTLAEQLDPFFLNLYLNAEATQRRLKGIATRAISQSNISATRLKGFPVPVPPLSEQRKIAAVLGEVQGAIGQQERLLATLTELKKTLLHQLLTQGLGGESQKETEIGPVPQSWEVVKLGELFQIKHGFAFAGEYFEPQGQYILLTPGHYNEDGGFRDQGMKTKYFSSNFPSSYILSKDDLLVVMTEQKEGLLGSSLLIPRDDLYLHNQRLGLIQDLDGSRLLRKFLYYLFNTQPVRKRISMTASGSKVRHTSPGKIRDTVVALPPIAHQERAVEVLVAADRKLDTTTKKHATLTALYRTLLHQLMTGQIRVSHISNFHNLIAHES
jgi:type I restriction enzyme S subunit